MVVWTSEFINEFVLVTILILFQIIGLYFAIRVKLILGKARFWDFIIIGLSLMFFRRIMLFLNLLGFSYFENSGFFHSLDTTYLPLITWLLLAMAFFELYLKVKNGKTFSSKKKSARKKKPAKKQIKTPLKQTRPTKIQRLFGRRTEDGYIDMTN